VDVGLCHDVIHIPQCARADALRICFSLRHVSACIEGETDGIVTWNVPARAVAAVAQCLAVDEDPIVR
jgi:hypothetical protein